MKTPTFACVAVLAVAGVAAQALEFPLQVTDMSLKEARSCPGGSGTYGSLRTSKPSELKKAPKAKSSRPLYAQVYVPDPTSKENRVRPGMIFFFDESKGDGKGYDRLIADVNGNGDLTDDAAIEGNPQERSGDGSGYESDSFGPLTMSWAKKVGDWQPRCYVELNVYSRSESYVGNMRTFAASYLATTVEVDGTKQKFGIVDGNCNGQLPEPARLVRLGSSETEKERRYYLASGDYFLRDKDDSGKFERKSGGADSEMFSSVIYFNAKPFAATVAADLRSIRIEPFAESVGEMAVQRQITDIVLGWEEAPDKWQALTPGIKDGKIILPEGKVRIANCTLGAQTKQGDWLKTGCYDYRDQTLQVKAGQTLKLQHGEPLALELTAKKGTTRREEGGGMMSAVRNLFGGLAGPRAALEMNVVISGAAGERYSSFYRTTNQPVAPPTFEIVDAAGKQLAGGKFEFG